MMNFKEWYLQCSAPAARGGFGKIDGLSWKGRFICPLPMEGSRQSVEAPEPAQMC
jgi:hypothetical protein